MDSQSQFGVDFGTVVFRLTPSAAGEELFIFDSFLVGTANVRWTATATRRWTEDYVNDNRFSGGAVSKWNGNTTIKWVGTLAGKWAGEVNRKWSAIARRL